MFKSYQLDSFFFLLKLEIGKSLKICWIDKLDR